jgi:hypothetical protein
VTRSIFTGPLRVELAPSNDDEAKLFTGGVVTDTFARLDLKLTWEENARATAFVYSSPAHLRAMGELFNAAASRMERLEQARAIAIPETAPGG